MSSANFRPLPERLQILRPLALDLFWTWSHAGDAMWRCLDPDTWDQTKNPWFILTQLPAEKLTAAASNPRFLALLDALVEERRQYLNRRTWFDQLPKTADTPKNIAYFSMEFGLSEALPLYAGGLGILAGDYLKAASDLGVPAIGVGLLYQEDYFRQYIDATGRQVETYPHNEPASLPIEPVLTKAGDRLRVQVDLPGRTLSLRVWQATVGRSTLYLMDSNDLLNTAVDRGITSQLYGGGQEMRFLQELVLGIGGWRALEAMGIDIDICHLNEGHAAMAILARTLSVMTRTGLDFWPAFWTARAGNVFTTHTPVSAGFDRFSKAQTPFPARFISDYLAPYNIEPEQILALGRQDPNDSEEPFNMTWFAVRGSAQVNAVSARHERVSKELFHPLYQRWPFHEIPVGHVTNGIHTPSWDSIWADDLWTEHCGKERWCDTTESLSLSIETLNDEHLWTFRARQRADLIDKTRKRWRQQRALHAASAADRFDEAILDPNALTIGFARRFTGYKRPNLLLKDPARLTRLLTDPDRPLQIVVAGKAHPRDREGQEMLADWINYTARPEVLGRAVFLEDYNIGLAQELVAGVDVWVNTPRPPMEACGTSGMKILVNGGLNLSVLDGWWHEAFIDTVGWAIGSDDPATYSDSDDRDADALYVLLEQKIIPDFYDRPDGHVPCNWVARVRTSMATLAPRFSANRMVREYYERYYCAAAPAFRKRTEANGHLGFLLNEWQNHLIGHWSQIHFGDMQGEPADQGLVFRLQVYLGEITLEQVSIELYAAPDRTGDFFLAEMPCLGPIAGTKNGYIFQAFAPADRPGNSYTARVRPRHADAFLPAELPLIRWQK